MKKYHTVGKYCTVEVILLFVGIGIIPFISLCNAGSDEYYFENVNILIVGGCRSCGSDGGWSPPLYIGTLRTANVATTGTRLERIRVTIYNTTISDPWVKLSGLRNDTVFMRDNVKGVFFVSTFKQYSHGKIPFIVFVSCHADRVWIYEYNSSFSKASLGVMKSLYIGYSSKAIGEREWRECYC
jgi:hypothetical protein